MGTALFGRRSGLVYGGVLLLVIMGLAFAEPLGLPVLPTRSTATHRMMGAMMSVAAGVALMTSWTFERERHLRQLEATAAERDARARDAERAANARTRFLESMSHELRTPLNHVLGSARSIAHGPLTPNVRRDLVALQRGAASLSTMVDDVLDLVALGDGTLSLLDEEFSPADVVREAADALGPDAATKGLPIHLALDADLPEGVSGDPRRLRQILTNLLANAVRFTEEGHVQIRSGLRSGDVVFEVEDTGCGISPDAVERLTDAFEQGEGVHRIHGGRGLGLSLATGLAEAMGGTLSVQSEVGRGTTVTVRLPLPRVEAPALTPTAFAGSRVLVVDDNPVNRRVVRSLLEHRGLEVDEAGDGSEAVDSVRARPPAAILMDVEMPVLDGYGATAALRTAGFDVPIIALTAHTLPEAVARGREAGMDAHLGKPVDPDLLARTLARWLPTAPTSRAA